MGRGFATRVRAPEWYICPQGWGCCHHGTGRNLPAEEGVLALWYRQPFAGRGRGVATIVQYRKSFAWMGVAVTMVQSDILSQGGVVTMVQAVLCLHGLLSPRYRDSNAFRGTAVLP